MRDGIGMAVMVIAAVGLVILYALYIGPQRKRSKLMRWIRGGFGGMWETGPVAHEVMEDIAAHYRAQRTADPDPLDVDDITWRDLDMDLVFPVLNRCQSSAGEERLYAMLHKIGADDISIQRRIALVNHFQSEQDEAVRLSVPLARMGKVREHGADAYLFQPAAKRPQNRFAYQALAVLPLAMLLLGLVSPLFLIFFGLLFGVNTVVYYRSAKMWRSEIRAVRQISRVMGCARELSRMNVPFLAPELSELRALLAELRTIARWGGLLGMEGVGDAAFLMEYVKILFQTDMLSLIRIAAHIERHAAALRRLYQLVGELDVLLGVASLRLANPEITTSEFTSERRVTAEDVVHPLVPHPVPNSIRWERSVLVTGSNASGKSTFVKALAVNAILAQSLGIAYAGRFTLPRAKVLSSMAVRDNVVEGDSYFIAEIKSLRRILDAIHPERPALCFVDEVLRGTNTVERIAASSALLGYMARQNALVMAATHDMELTALLADCYEMRHFREEIVASKMVFSYRLMDGPSDTRNAIALLGLLHFPDDVVHAARAAAARYDLQHSWAGIRET